MGRATAVKHTAQIRAPWGEGNLLLGQRDCHPPCGGSTSHKVRQHCWSCRLAPWSLRDDSISLFISIKHHKLCRLRSGGRRQSTCLQRVFSQPCCPQEQRGALEHSLPWDCGQGCLGSATALHKSHPCSHHPSPWCTHIRTFPAYFSLPCSWE